MVAFDGRGLYGYGGEAFCRGLRGLGLWGQKFFSPSCFMLLTPSSSNLKKFSFLRGTSLGGQQDEVGVSRTEENFYLKSQQRGREHSAFFLSPPEAFTSSHEQLFLLFFFSKNLSYPFLPK
jgi:hypothetical protein